AAEHIDQGGLAALLLRARNRQTRCAREGVEHVAVQDPQDDGHPLVGREHDVMADGLAQLMKELGTIHDVVRRHRLRQRKRPTLSARIVAGATLCLHYYIEDGRPAPEMLSRRPA